MTYAFPQVTADNINLFVPSDFHVQHGNPAYLVAPFASGLAADIASAISTEDGETLALPEGYAEVLGFSLRINDEPFFFHNSNEADKIMRGTPMGGELDVFHSTSVAVALAADTVLCDGRESETIKTLVAEGMRVIFNLRTVVAYNRETAMLHTFVGADINPRNITVFKDNEKIDTPEFVTKWLNDSKDAGVMMRFAMEYIPDESTDDIPSEEGPAE